MRSTRKRSLKMALAGVLIFVAIGGYIVDRLLLVRSIFLDVLRPLNERADGEEKGGNIYFSTPEFDAEVVQKMRNAIYSTDDKPEQGFRDAARLARSLPDFDRIAREISISKLPLAIHDYPERQIDQEVLISGDQPEYDLARKTVSCWVAVGIAQAMKGQFEVASDVLLSAYGIGTVFENDPRFGVSLLTKMIAIAAYKRAARGILHLVNQYELPHPVLRHLYRSLTIMKGDMVPLSLAIETEYLFILHLGDYLENRRQAGPKKVSRRLVSFFSRKAKIEAEFYPYFKPMIEAAALPYPGGRKRFSRIHDKLIHLSKQLDEGTFFEKYFFSPDKAILKLLVAMMVPNCGRAFDHVVEAETLTNMVLIRLRLEMFRVENGGYPGSLDFLKKWGDETLAIDPFRPDHSLEFEYDKTRYCLRSAGPTADSSEKNKSITCIWSR